MPGNDWNSQGPLVMATLERQGKDLDAVKTAVNKINVDTATNHGVVLAAIERVHGKTRLGKFASYGAAVAITGALIAFKLIGD